MHIRAQALTHKNAMDVAPQRLRWKQGAKKSCVKAESIENDPGS